VEPRRGGREQHGSSGVGVSRSSRVRTQLPRHAFCKRQLLELKTSYRDEIYGNL
jgi:hypothetical protein